MRPRKRVLLLDGDLERRSVRAFVLQNTGKYRVHATNVGTVGDLAGFDAAVVDGPAAWVRCAVLEMKRAQPDLPVLAIGCADSTADRWLESGRRWPAQMEELLHALRLLALRKRGPQPEHSRSRELDQGRGQRAAAFTAELTA